MTDIVPELLEKIKAEFKREYSKSPKIKKAIEDKLAGTATYEDANNFAEEVGDIMARVLKNNITEQTLPDGTVYRNIADRILNESLKSNHKLISEFAADVQTELNKKAKLGIKGVKPKLNQSKIDGLVNKVSGREYEKVKWVFDEPIVNFSQSVINDAVKENTNLHYELGLKPKIIRKEAGNCCDWCREMVGTYEYPEVPKDVYRRHRFCRCTIEYDPGDGKIQNVHTKKWIDPEKDSKINTRKQDSLKKTD